MAKLKWKGGALVAPVPPAMISCGNEADGTANIITIAWTGIVNTVPPKTYISVRPSRHSYKLIKENGEFVINLTTKTLVRHADYCGVYTGAKVNKFEKCGLNKEAASEVSCPLIAESPLSLECRVTDVIPMGSHDMFLADIVAVDVDESLIDKDGKSLGGLVVRVLAGKRNADKVEPLLQKLLPYGFQRTKHRADGLLSLAESRQYPAGDIFTFGEFHRTEHFNSRDGAYHLFRIRLLQRGDRTLGLDLGSRNIL